MRRVESLKEFAEGLGEAAALWARRKQVFDSPFPTKALKSSKALIEEKRDKRREPREGERSEAPKELEEGLGEAVTLGLDENKYLVHLFSQSSKIKPLDL